MAVFLLLKEEAIFLKNEATGDDHAVVEEYVNIKNLFWKSITQKYGMGTTSGMSRWWGHNENHKQTNKNISFLHRI